MNYSLLRDCWRTTSALILILQAPLVMAQHEMRGPVPAEASATLETLREISEQRRPRLLFPNEQSLFHGARHGFVNSSAGNLSFVHRDLALAGTLPVQIARVYDSRSGWRLSVVETLRAQGDDWFDYTDASGVVTSIRPARGGVQLLQPRPLPLVRFDTDGASYAELHFIDGLVRRFKLIGGVFRQTSVTDRNGNRFNLHYSANRIVRLQAANGRSIDIERDANGQLSAATDEQGRRVEYSYDAYGTLQAVKDIAGELWHYEYASDGRLVRITDPLGAELLVAGYNASGKVSQLTRDNAVTRFRYSDGTTTVQEHSGNETRYQHDADGAVISVLNAHGVSTRVERNANRQATSLWRNDALLYSFEYGAAGRLVAMAGHAQAGSVQRQFDYDDNGRVTSIADQSGVRLLGYDARGNPAALRNGDHWESFSWDSRGGLAQWRNGAGQDYWFASNRDGRLVVVSDSNEQTTNLFYREDGKLTALRLSNGAQHEYEYNAAGLRSAIRRWDGSAVLYEHDAAGRLIQVSVVEKDARRHTLTMGFEGRALMSDIAIDGAAVNIQYDTAGNPTEIFATTPGTRARRVAAYQYDAVNRLSRAEIGGENPVVFDYEPGAADVVASSDTVTGVARHAWSGGGFGALFGAAGFPVNGAVELDPSSREFRPLNGEGVAVPFDTVSQTLNEMRVLGLGGADAATVNYFEAASNRVFTPQEYHSVNCCGFPCEELGGFHCRITCFPPPPDDPPLPPFIQLILDNVVVINSGTVILEMRVVGGILTRVETFGPGFDSVLHSITGAFSLFADPDDVPANQPGAFIVRGSNGQSYQVTLQHSRHAAVNDNIILGTVTVGGVLVPVSFNQHAQDEVQRLSVTSAVGNGNFLLAGESFLTLSNIMRPPLPNHYAQWNAEHQYWSASAGNHNLVAMTPWNSPGPWWLPADSISDLRRSQASRVYGSGESLKGLFYTRYIAMQSAAGPVAVLALVGNTLEVPVN